MEFKPSNIVNPDPTVPLLAHIPHSSAFVPSHMRDQIILSESDLKEEMSLLTDWFTDDLYSPVTDLGGTAVVFALSRFIVDPERFEDDAEEVMAKRGMGFIYTKTTSGRDLRRSISEAERVQLLEAYRFHHLLLSSAADKIIKKFGYCIFIDCHSYPDRALPYELFPDKARPAVCLGTDKFHTPDYIGSMVPALANDFGFSSGLNEPFAGSLVPMEYYQKDKRLVSFMLELNRAIYMDEQKTVRSDGFGTTKEFIATLCGRLVQVRNDLLA